MCAGLEKSCSPTIAMESAGDEYCTKHISFSLQLESEPQSNVNIYITSKFWVLYV
jgi:hypothetical protein